MKNTFISFGLLVLVAGVALTWYGRGTPQASAEEKKAAAAEAAARPLGVEDFMKHVDMYKGSVVLEGVVSSSSSEKRMLSLIDRHEFEECGMKGCAAYVLPVSWSGKMPAVKQIVRAEGEVKKSEGKLVFVASSIDGMKQQAVEGKEEDEKK